MSFKKILFVPTTDRVDQPGVRALLTLAGPNAEVEIFEPVYSTDLEAYAALDGETYERVRDELVQTRLQRIAGLGASLEERGLKISTTAAWDHPVHETIIRRAMSTRADLVITEPVEGRPGALSNGDWRLISRCPVPLLLIRRDSAGEYSKIVAAVDPFHAHAKPAELDATILQRAKEIQSLTHGELQVVNCFPPLTEILPGPYGEHLPIDDAEDSLEAYRQDMLTKLVEEAGLGPGAAKLLQGKPSDALRELLEAGETDLLVMGALSRGRIRDFVLGSTAESILYHTDVDILLVKPPGFETTVAEQAPKDSLIGPLYFPV